MSGRYAKFARGLRQGNMYLPTLVLPMGMTEVEQFTVDSACATS
jgi:hypothetical protein